ncbi:hypothetical protein ACXGXA_24595 [Salmonella enterica subsp. enterica serovar Infantis]
MAADDSIDIEVAPSWRPDKVFKIELDGYWPRPYIFHNRWSLCR